MKPTKFLHPLSAILFAMLLASCGGHNDAASGTPGKSTTATASAVSPTNDTNALLAKGAALNRAELQRAAQSAPAGF